MPDPAAALSYLQRSAPAAKAAGAGGMLASQAGPNFATVLPCGFRWAYLGRWAPAGRVAGVLVPQVPVPPRIPRSRTHAPAPGLLPRPAASSWCCSAPGAAPPASACLGWRCAMRWAARCTSGQTRCGLPPRLLRYCRAWPPMHAHQTSSSTAARGECLSRPPALPGGHCVSPHCCPALRPSQPPACLHAPHPPVAERRSTAG